MNLYLISQMENTGYDTYDSAIVAAENETDARNTLPSDFEEWGKKYSAWCKYPSQVEVELIGTAVEGTLAGVVLASFNAG